MGMRSALASVGVVLSARAFAGWIKGALDAKNMTEQQLAATKEARAAVEGMKTASDNLARSLGTTLAPAISTVAKLLTGLNAAFFGASPYAYEEQIASLQEKLESLGKLDWNAPIASGRRILSAQDEQVAAALREQIADLKKKQLESLTTPQGPAADVSGLDKFDMDSFIGEMAMGQIEAAQKQMESLREAGKKLAESMRTDVEKGIDEWNDAKALFEGGFISGETLQRVQDDLLQPIKVTAQYLKDANAERLKDLAQTFKSEEQLEVERYAQRLEDLQDLYDAELVQRSEFLTLKEELESEHQDRMTEIDAAAADEQLRIKQKQQTDTLLTIVSGLTDATAAMSNSSKRMFDMNKKFAKAEAVINAYRAIQQVWADPTLPFYAKIAATALTAVKTAANISAINSATFGGGTTPSAAGGATVNNVPVGSGQVYTVRGINKDDFFSGRQLIELINQAQKDGARLVFAN